MKRKTWVRLLSCVVALMLPLSAMAQSAAIDLLKQAVTDGKEIVSTITFAPGTTLAADKAVADLSAAAAIRINKLPGGYGAFALVLSGVDTVSAQLRVETDGVYVQSETLGDKPLYFSWEDVNKGITEAMKSSGADQASIDQFTNGFTSALQQITAAGAVTATEGTEAKPLTEEEIKQKITASMGGDEAFVKWMSAIEAKKVVTTGEFTLGDSDTADTKTEITLTKEDMASLYDVPYIQKQVTTQIKSQDATLTDEQAAAKTAETIATIKAEILKSDATMPITLYTKGENSLVAAEATLTGNFTKDVTMDATATTDAAAPTPTVAEPTISKVNAYFMFTKKTADPAKTYNFKMSVTMDDKKQADVTGIFTHDGKTAAGSFNVINGDGKTLFVANGTADYSDAKHTTGTLDITASESQTPMAVLIAFDQVTGDKTIDTSLSISSGVSVEAIKAAADTTLLGTIKVNTVVQDDSGLFTTLKEAAPTTSLEVLKLSAQELQTYLGKLQSNAMQTLYKVLGNLPASVSSAMGGAMGGQ